MRRTMNSTLSTNNDTAVAALAPPEDLRCGDYVAALNSIVEFPSFLLGCDSSIQSVDQPVRTKFRAAKAGVPLRIRAICIPFVFIKTPKGRAKIIDVRETQLVRLDRRYAKLAWKALKRKRKNGR